MNKDLRKDIGDLAAAFESEVAGASTYPLTVEGFRQWIVDTQQQGAGKAEPDWEGKEGGRSAESVINTLIVHLNRYGKTYGKAAIQDSRFSTQDEFSYLITLQASGPMGKMELIRKNVEEKPTGMQIVNRLIARGWVAQEASIADRRSKLISITKRGTAALSRQMEKIRRASRIVTGNLNAHEKNMLIHLLQKLEEFHQPIFSKGLSGTALLDAAQGQLSTPSA